MLLPTHCRLPLQTSTFTTLDLTSFFPTTTPPIAAPIFSSPLHHHYPTASSWVKLSQSQLSKRSVSSLPISLFSLVSLDDVPRLLVRTRTRVQNISGSKTCSAMAGSSSATRQNTNIVIPRPFAITASPCTESRLVAPLRSTYSFFLCPTRTLSHAACWLQISVRRRGGKRVPQ